MTVADYWYIVFSGFGLLCAWASIKGLSDD
jgi:hypothetical protein